MAKTPKQPSVHRDRDWYPYYAGYTETFVESVLANDLAGSKCVIDPWSGSGTTSTVCARLGIASTGVEINPVMNLIARGRLVPKTRAGHLRRYARSLVRSVTGSKEAVREPDLLTLWFTEPTVGTIRSLEESILGATRGRGHATGQVAVSEADSFSPVTCFMYTALFAMTRDLLSGFRATNPTWLKIPKASEDRISVSSAELTASFRERVQYFSQRLALPGDLESVVKPRFITGSTTDLPLPDGSFDACLTSPPYATRIDYIKATLVELAVLGLDEAAISDLRVRAMGTPVVRGFEGAESVVTSVKASDLLSLVRAHSSKGSRTYYYPWLLKYFVNLQEGLAEVDRVVSGSCPIALVVQDSHYKEIGIDLQGIIVEMFESLGRGLIRRRDFEVTRLRSRQNPKALAHKKERKSSETLLIFG